MECSDVTTLQELLLLECLDTADTTLEHTAVVGFARIPFSIDSAVVDFASGLDFSRATGCVRCVRVFFGNYWSVWTQRTQHLSTPR